MDRRGTRTCLSLRDSGITVASGLPATSRSRRRRRQRSDGRRLRGVAAWADVMMMLAPDTSQPAIYEEEILPTLAPGNLLPAPRLLHPSSGTITVRSDVDVAMVAPKSPGHRVRERCSSKGRHARRSSRSIRMRRARRGSSRSPMPRESASPVPESSRRRSPKKPETICSVSRSCCAAG